MPETSPYRLLTFSTLFPNARMPRHGLFVEKRLTELLSSGRAVSRVVAPVPWFPSDNRVFGEYARYAAVPRRETRGKVEVLHPRYPLLPAVGMSSAPYSMARFTRRALQRVLRDGYDFDVIDAHYFYPDGVAAVMLGRALRKPVIITARGTDLNLIPRYRVPRRLIQWAASKADGLITVCAALRDALTGLGVDPSRVRVLRNGVDLDFFFPRDRREARRELGLPEDRTLLISVGLLIDRKGHDIPIRGLSALPNASLLIAGEGDKREELEQLAVREGVADRVEFLGGVPQERLRTYLSAVDALVLASSREGWANVLLEAMACGTPVIASDVWGTPEVVRSAEAGILMGDRSAAAFVRAYEQLMASYPDRAATRRYAEQFSWRDTTEGQLELIGSVLRERAR